MRPDGGDAARLWDMLEHARLIQRSMTGKSLTDYLTDDNLRHATERRLEIIGEAAHAISQTFRDSHPGIPWHQIVAQRNVLAHGYSMVRHHDIWRLARNEISDLIKSLVPLVPPPPPENPT